MRTRAPISRFVSTIVLFMRDDLLPAQAAVDWTISQLPPFEQRLNLWLNNNTSVTVKELPTDTPNNIVVATEKEPLPLSFNVEAGAYINVLRSSLDILATALANRHGIADLDECYFPIVGSALLFESGKGFKGDKFIQGLPDAERMIFKGLKPYKGGNDALYALHRLDILRKHRRLIATEVIPSTMRLIGNMKFTPVSTGFMRSADNETVLGLVPKGASNPVAQYTSRIIFREADTAPPMPVVPAIRELASVVQAVIKLFDR